MKKLIFVAAVFLSYVAMAQDDNCSSEITYYSLEEALIEPQKVKKLDLAMQQPKLTSIPKEVSLLPNLECLDVSFNRVAVIPEEIAQCKKLRYINLAGNRYLAKMPEILKNVESLKVVDVSSIPEWSTQKREDAKKMLAGVKVITD